MAIVTVSPLGLFEDEDGSLLADSWLWGGSADAVRFAPGMHASRINRLAIHSAR